MWNIRGILHDYFNKTSTIAFSVKSSTESDRFDVLTSLDMCLGDRLVVVTMF